MNVPIPGTPAFEEFARKAATNPSGVEAAVLRQASEQAMNQHQEQVRTLLLEMIRIVPGQLFRDVELFHKKFELAETDHPNHELTPELQGFRTKFMWEELKEYCDASGVTITATLLADGTYKLGFEPNPDAAFNAEDAFDALIDLVYVALGTALLHGFPFNAGWQRVQDANLQKVRAERADQSKRGSTFDVIKPPHWQAPSHKDLLRPRKQDA